MKRDLIHWNYFLALERKMEEISFFIEFNQANYKTYSVELLQVLLACGSGIDVVAKELCRNIGFNTSWTDDNRGWTIGKYQEGITGVLKRFCSCQAIIPTYRDILLKPWESWLPDIPPNWWTAYNATKHRRASEYCEANLENTLLAFAGLFILTAHYYSYPNGNDTYSSNIIPARFIDIKLIGNSELRNPYANKLKSYYQ